MKGQVSPKPAIQPQVEPAGLVLCKACHHSITSPSLRYEWQGQHEQTFRNPHAYSFHVLCYRDAPGALDVGEPTLEATWFANHAWSLALCEGCHEHLGWWYSGQQRFVGLIATRLLRPQA